MIYVLDASVSLKWFIKEEGSPFAEEVLKRVLEKPMGFAVPELFAFELFAVLARLHQDSLRVFTEGVIPILQSGILRYPMTEELSVNALKFINSGLTGYDACYAALALSLNGMWLTFDSKAHRLIKNKSISFLLSEGLPEIW